MGEFNNRTNGICIRKKNIEGGEILIFKPNKVNIFMYL